MQQSNNAVVIKYLICTFMTCEMCVGGGGFIPHLYFYIFTWEREQQRIVGCGGGLVNRVGGTSLLNTNTI